MTPATEQDLRKHIAAQSAAANDSHIFMGQHDSGRAERSCIQLPGTLKGIAKQP